MHELFIAQSILTSVSEALPKDVLPESVSTIRVQVGMLDAVVPDSLIFSFDAIKSSSGMPNAELSIEQIPVYCRCKDCQSGFGLDLPIFICPECQSGNVEILQGRGIMLTGITAEEPDGETG